MLCMRLARVAWLALVPSSFGCDAVPAAEQRPEPALARMAPAPAAETAKSPVKRASVAKRKPSAKAQKPPVSEETSACPEDMALVSGDHCRAVEQRCLEYKVVQGVEDDNRCLKFEK